MKIWGSIFESNLRDPQKWTLVYYFDYSIPKRYFEIDERFCFRWEAILLIAQHVRYYWPVLLLVEWRKAFGIKPREQRTGLCQYGFCVSPEQTVFCDGRNISRGGFANAKCVSYCAAVAVS